MPVTVLETIQPVLGAQTSNQAIYPYRGNIRAAELPPLCINSKSILELAL